MPENLPSISSQSSVDTPPLSSQSSLDRSDSRENSETSSPHHQTTNRDNDSSLNSTPTHSIGSSSSTDTPVCNIGASNRNGTLRRVEYFDNLEKSTGSKSISTDDSWIEKGLNRSLSGPDCLQRHRTDSDTDSVNSLQFREDDNMTMSTDSGLEVTHRKFISLINLYFFKCTYQSILIAVGWRCFASQARLYRDQTTSGWQTSIAKPIKTSLLDQRPLLQSRDQFLHTASRFADVCLGDKFSEYPGSYQSYAGQIQSRCQV